MKSKKVRAKIQKKQEEGRGALKIPLVAATTMTIMLLILELILHLAADKSAGKTADEAVAKLVATKSTGSTASQGAHQATITLSLGAGIRRAVLALLLLMLLLRVRRVGISRVRVAVVSALLRELLRGRLAWVRALVLAVTVVAMVSRCAGFFLFMPFSRHHLM